MAVFNRFSRDPQVAKFDPMTAEEIMKVPIAKQVLEDEQVAEGDKLLQEMYATRSVEADAERINARKRAMEVRMNDLSDDITKNGISNNVKFQIKKQKELLFLF